MLLPDLGLASANFRQTAQVVRNSRPYYSFGARVSTETQLVIADALERMADRVEDAERFEASR